MTEPAFGPTPGGPIDQRHDLIPRQLPAVPAAAVPVAWQQQNPLLIIGDIVVTPGWVQTPAGSCPLRGSRWHAQEQWATSQRTPVWAIVLAIVGFCVLTIFSLLFLLAKETIHTGVMSVTVSHGPFVYSTRVPIFDQNGAYQVWHQVNHARSLALA